MIELFIITLAICVVTIVALVGCLCESLEERDMYRELYMQSEEGKLQDFCQQWVQELLTKLEGK